VLAHCTITGHHFVDGAVVTTVPGIPTIENVVVVDEGTITCDITPGELGFFDVVVTNPDDQFCTLENAFECTEF